MMARLLMVLIRLLMLGLNLKALRHAQMSLNVIL